jgi:uncharacterized protein YuzE
MVGAVQQVTLPTDTDLVYVQGVEAASVIDTLWLPADTLLNVVEPPAIIPVTAVPPSNETLYGAVPPIGKTLILPVEELEQDDVILSVNDNNGVIGITLAVPHLGLIFAQLSLKISRQRGAVSPEASVHARNTFSSVKPWLHAYVIVRGLPFASLGVIVVVEFGAIGPPHPFNSIVVCWPLPLVCVKVPKKANEVRVEPVLFLILILSVAVCVPVAEH